jgi:hypothetical protein
MNVTQIRPAHIRMAGQWAAERGIQFPSHEFDQLVSAFLNRLTGAMVVDPGLPADDVQYGPGCDTWEEYCGQTWEKYRGI